MKYIDIEEIAKSRDKIAFWVEDEEMYDTLKKAGIDLCSWHKKNSYSNKRTYIHGSKEKAQNYWNKKNTSFFEIKQNTYYEIY